MRGPGIKPGQVLPHMVSCSSDVTLLVFLRCVGWTVCVQDYPAMPHLNLELASALSQVGNVDFAPTWVELAGLEDPLAATRDGISLVPILLGQPDVLENPEHHRVGILVSSTANSCGQAFAPLFSRPGCLHLLLHVGQAGSGCGCCQTAEGWASAA